MEHRRNKLREPREETVEFKLLCKVKNNPEDDGYQDTFYLDPNLLAESNFSKRSMLESCKQGLPSGVMGGVPACHRGLGSVGQR